jgi:hypothetical protein
MFQDTQQMRENQEVRNKVIRAFQILRGLFSGASSHKNFALLFDWFYPDYFGLVK